MVIVTTGVRIDTQAAGGQHIHSFRVILNVSDNILEAVDATGKAWASAKTIEGLQQQLYGMTIETKDLGDEDVNRDCEKVRCVRDD